MEPTDKNPQIEPVVPIEPLAVISGVVESGQFFLLYPDSQKKKKHRQMKVYKKGRFSELLKIIGIASVVELESEGEMFVLHKESLDRFIDEHKASEDEQIKEFALCLEERKYAIEDARRIVKPCRFKEVFFGLILNKPFDCYRKEVLKEPKNNKRE